MFVITGGGSGIGRALTESLVARGSRVLIVGRREQLLQETAKLSNSIDYIQADIASEVGLQSLVMRLKYENSLSGLIHNAGVIDPIMPMADLEPQAWRKILSINLDAPFFLTQALKQQLVGGRVLHVGSGAAYFPVAGWAPYCVSKAGLAMLTKCWQLECPEIAFASVMPGIIDTDMQAQIRASTSMQQDKYEFFLNLKKNHQLLSVQQVASYLTWLLLDIESTEFSSKEWDIYESYAKFPE